MKLADAVAGGNHRRQPSKVEGDRLPPQRQLPTTAQDRRYRRASRVYGELLRRGLVVGEVGRGTFISGQSAPRNSQASTEPRGAQSTLNSITHYCRRQSALIAKSLEGLEPA